MSTEPEPAGPAPVDDNGTPFRSGFHRTKADGSPFRGRFGQFMPKGGRKPKADQGATPGPALPDVGAHSAGAGIRSVESGAAISEPAPANFDDVARIVAGGVPDETKAPDAKAVVVEPISLETSWDASLRGAYSVTDAVVKGKGEWQPENPAEHLGLRDTWATCARAYGWQPLPPILAAVGSSIAYVWRRLTLPNTAKTIARWFPSLAQWLGIEVPKTEAEKAAEKTAEAKPAVVPAERQLTARAESFFE